MVLSTNEKFEKIDYQRLANVALKGIKGFHVDSILIALREVQTPLSRAELLSVLEGLLDEVELDRTLSALVRVAFLIVENNKTYKIEFRNPDLVEHLVDIAGEQLSNYRNPPSPNNQMPIISSDGKVRIPW